MSDKTSCHAYQRVLEPFSAQELSLVAQIKRFFEWAQGDPDFCQSVDSGDLSPEYRERLKRIGVTFDLDGIALLWESPEVVTSCFLRCGCGYLGTIPEENIEALVPYPLLHLWARFLSHRNTIQREVCRQLPSVPLNPKFDAWLQRRIAAVRSELGFLGYSINHPILAFELGDGCSVGCWFCAFAARKLTANFDYDENRDFFREVAEACVDLFGKRQASMALLYYGTEPHDNPHYLDFLKDYEEITGEVVCTSTTAGTDAEWMRELLAYYRQGNYPWPRLSVLSRGMMYKIHDLYSPDELRDVELLMQMKEHPRKKISGGRILKEESGLRDREKGHYLDGAVPQGSIACVSGLLTNMSHRTIQLVSPCYASKQWPFGYRVFDEVTFDDARGFGDGVETIIDRNMPQAPIPDNLARFRDDLCYRKTDEGFDLISPNQVHHFSGKEVYKPLGRLIAEGNASYNELYDAMIDRYHINPMAAVAVVQKLFDAGFLSELNHLHCHSGRVYAS